MSMCTFVVSSLLTCRSLIASTRPQQRMWRQRQCFYGNFDGFDEEVTGLCMHRPTMARSQYPAVVSVALSYNAHRV